MKTASSREMGLTAGIINRRTTLSASQSYPEDSAPTQVIYARPTAGDGERKAPDPDRNSAWSWSGHNQSGGQAVVVFATCAILLLAPSPGVQAIAQEATVEASTPYSVAIIATEPINPWPKDRFLCFSNTAQIPPIQIPASNDSIRVGQLGVLSIHGLSALTDQDAKPIAGELGVPSGLVTQVAKAASQDPHVTAALLAQRLRGAVIAFRYLLAELTAYHPAANDQPAADNARQQLLNGDLPSVWRFYQGLPWPAPPTIRIQAPINLRVVAGQ